MRRMRAVLLSLGLLLLARAAPATGAALASQESDLQLRARQEAKGAALMFSADDSDSDDDDSDDSDSDDTKPIDPGGGRSGYSARPRPGTRDVKVGKLVMAPGDGSAAHPESRGPPDR